MDNNFSAQVKEIISYSREEALRLGNDFIGTEHLVLGLIRDGENNAVKILRALNIDLYELRKEIEIAELKFSKMRMDYNSFFCNQFNR